jgi:hypothetical protein
MRPVHRCVSIFLAVGILALAGGCGDVSGGTGLVGGTIDNGLAKSMQIGLKQSDAEDWFNGEPLDSAPYYRGRTSADKCVYYRGVRLHGISYAEATGTVWRLCFNSGALVIREPVCPIPWDPGELQRYRSNHYVTRRSDCGGV